MLVLAFAASGAASHFGSGPAAAGSHAHNIIALSLEAGSDADCAEHDVHIAGSVCSMAGSCALGMPADSAAVLAMAGAGKADLRPETAQLGCTLPVHLHPPKPV